MVSFLSPECDGIQRAKREKNGKKNHIKRFIYDMLLIDIQMMPLNKQTLNLGKEGIFF